MYYYTFRRHEEKQAALVGIINGFSSSTDLPPICTCVRSICLFTLEFHLQNKFIQRFALFHWRSGSVPGILSGQKLGDVQDPDGESSGLTFSIPRCAVHRAANKQSKDESYTCWQFLCDEFYPSDQVIPVVPDPTTRPNYNGRKDAEYESKVQKFNSDKI